MGFWVGILIGVIALPYIVAIYVLVKSPVISPPRKPKPVNLKKIIKNIKKALTIGPRWSQGYACGSCNILWQKRNHGQKCPRCNTKGVELKYRAN